MAFYGDVLPGDEFRPSASLSNDIRHFLNGLNGFHGNQVGSNGAGTVRIQVYNATGETLDAGTAVNFDNGRRMVDDAVPAKRFSDPKNPWGVVTQMLKANEMGDCFISGPVRVKVSGSGDYAQPTAASPSTFTRGSEGAPVLYSNGGNAVINLGAGTPENYDGPFALSYDSEKQMLKIRDGYLSRNGELLAVTGIELSPENGLVCVYSELDSETGEWSVPEIKFGTPDKYTYPIGKCKVEGSGDTQSVSVCSFRVPVAILIDTATCPLSTEYKE